MPSLDISSPLTGGPRQAKRGPSPTPSPLNDAGHGPSAAGRPGAFGNDGGVKSPGPGPALPSYPQGASERSELTVEEPTTPFTMETGRPDARIYGGSFQAELNPAAPSTRGNDPRLGPVGPAIQMPGRVEEAVRRDSLAGAGTVESIGPSSTTPQESISQAQGQNLFGSRSGTPRGQIRSVRTQPE